MKKISVTNKFNLIQLTLTVLLVISAFLVGTLYTKVQYLEKGEVSGAQVAAEGDEPAVNKGSITDALKDIAKATNLDEKKFDQCISSDSKKKVVQADFLAGQGVGVRGTPGIFINGKFLGGALPYEVFKELVEKELDGTASESVSSYSETIKSYVDRGSIILTPKEIVVGNAPTKGSKNPKVTIVEFSDFQCPFCATVTPTLEKVLSDFKDVQLVFKHYPLSFHQHAEITAIASVCAQDQGKFWDFHNKLFATQGEWSQI